MRTATSATAPVTAVTVAGRSATRRTLAWAAALLALGAVFLAYLDPHLAVELANRVWACF